MREVSLVEAYQEQNINTSEGHTLTLNSGAKIYSNLFMDYISLILANIVLMYKATNLPLELTKKLLNNSNCQNKKAHLLCPKINESLLYTTIIYLCLNEGTFLPRSLTNLRILYSRYSQYTSSENKSKLNYNESISLQNNSQSFY